MYIQNVIHTLAGWNLWAFSDTRNSWSLTRWWHKWSSASVNWCSCVGWETQIFSVVQYCTAWCCCLCASNQSPQNLCSYTEDVDFLALMECCSLFTLYSVLLRWPIFSASVCIAFTPLSATLISFHLPLNSLLGKQSKLYKNKQHFIPGINQENVNNLFILFITFYLFINANNGSWAQ